MTRKILIAAWAVVALAAASAVIWFYAAGDVGDPTEVTAPPITAPSPETAPNTTAPATDQAPTSTILPAARPEVTNEDAASSTATSAPDGAPEVTTGGSTFPTTTSTTNGATASGEGSEVTPEELGDTVELELAEGTEARFVIYEDLRGEPFTVVGATTEVVGRVNLNLTSPAASRMGDILINARTFMTDSSIRDRAIRGPILNSEQFEFVTFRPMSIRGFSGTAEAGSEWRLLVEGDLTVRDITRPVTFDLVMRWGEDYRLEGEARATVLRSDFELSVPSVPFVANVADEIGLELDFIAIPAELG